MTYLYILNFWFILQLFGLVGWPLTAALLRRLPDRGYPFAKAVGLLFSGYVLWLAGSFGLLRNNLGGTILAMVVVAGGGWWWSRRQDVDLLGWLRANWRYVLSVEVLFALSFAGWAIFKAYNPDIMTAGGEKWMEIAFINATLLSPSFPPQDPWLAGFGISYYYFGYVLMSMLIRLSGIVSTTAFNLLIPALFALSLTAALSVVANLTAIQRGEATPGGLAIASGLLGAACVGVIGHWHGLLEMFHSRGLFSAAFWQWLDIRDLKIPPDGPGPWVPDRYNWWWRGSRVLTDYNLAGQEQEVIDEMPFFSFMLGDVHPHVLSLPFVLLAIALALNLWLSRRDNEPTAVSGLSWLGAVGVAVQDLSRAMGGWGAFLLYALAVGALGFINTWDLPIYFAVLGLAYWLWRGSPRPLEPIAGMVIFAALAIALYSPFYLTFQSQAGGILPNLWNPTRLPQFFVFFGPFLVTAMVFLAYLSHRNQAWKRDLRWTLPLTLILPVLLLVGLAVAFLIFPAGRAFIDGLLRDPNVQTALNGATVSDLLAEIATRRLGNPWTLLFLGTLLGVTAAHWWSRLTPFAPADDDLALAQTRSQAESFALVLLIMGLLLPLTVEVLFLRDLFNIRMNTIFKFYFQAWILLALASAFGMSYLLMKFNPLGQTLWAGVMVVMLSAAMVYPVLATLNKTNNFSGEPTLDGIAWVERTQPDDHAAILWLRENAAPDAIILEAPGSSYRYDNRVSALTGRATLLGWGFHQQQWRGNYDEPGRREPDIETIFNSADVQATLTLLDKYAINYVYVGPLERQRYRAAGLAKFDRLLEVAFAQGEVVVYAVPN